MRRALLALVLTALLAPAAGAQPALLALAGAELLAPHLSRAAPFPRPLAVAQALTAGDPGWQALLAPLEAVAPLGAPLPRQLAASFPAAAERAVLAEMGEAEPGRMQHWMAAAMRLGARFGARMGADDSPALAATAAAEALLDQGALAAADGVLATLQGPAAEALLPWRAQLARRLAADAAAAALAGLVAQRTGLSP
ncbi:hypothetical protein [Falsiroseomonas tokyonensis]|uniref:Uncharacterized protein n=1 Tax=Falsiroseomonas tokyonensis TaxID=430521 RepID=A0ABV7BMY9_9PROT|nr:hypothetical protein [Falsiroseomonas tokyonensis]MBU8536958.1 hypothetical protein [Falsiroseomonas tokyonensis]